MIYLHLTVPNLPPSPATSQPIAISRKRITCNRGPSPYLEQDMDDTWPRLRASTMVAHQLSTTGIPTTAITAARSVATIKPRGSGGGSRQKTHQDATVGLPTAKTNFKVRPCKLRIGPSTICVTQGSTIPGANSKLEGQERRGTALPKKAKAAKLEDR